MIYISLSIWKYHKCYKYQDYLLAFISIQHIQQVHDFFHKQCGNSMTQVNLLKKKHCVHFI